MISCSFFSWLSFTFTLQLQYVPQLHPVRTLAHLWPQHPWMCLCAVHTDVYWTSHSVAQREPTTFSLSWNFSEHEWTYSERRILNYHCQILTDWFRQKIAVFFSFAVFFSSTDSVLLHWLIFLVLCFDLQEVMHIIQYTAGPYTQPRNPRVDFNLIEFECMTCPSSPSHVYKSSAASQSSNICPSFTIPLLQLSASLPCYWSTDSHTNKHLFNICKTRGPVTQLTDWRWWHNCNLFFITCKR